MALNPDLDHALTQMFARSPRAGRLADPAPLEVLREGWPRSVPAWFITMVSVHQLAGMDLGWSVTDTFAGFVDEPLMFTWADAPLIVELSTACYPGNMIVDHGYLTVGTGVEGAGNVLVLDMGSDDPPVLEVWHDISPDPIVVLRAVRSRGRGARLLAPSLSTFFTRGIVDAPGDAC